MLPDVYNCYAIKARIQITRERRETRLPMATSQNNRNFMIQKPKTDDYEVRLTHFRKTVGYGDALFDCVVCGKQRIYGAGVPENPAPYLLCEGTCGKHTLHNYVHTHGGRVEKVA